MNKLLLAALISVAENRRRIIASLLVLLAINSALLLYIMIGTESVDEGSSAPFAVAKGFAFEDFDDNDPEDQRHLPDDSAIPQASTVINYFAAVVTLVASLIIFFVLFMLHFYLGIAAVVGSLVWLIMGIINPEPSLLGINIRIIPVLIGSIFSWVKSRNLVDKRNRDIEDNIGF